MLNMNRKLAKRQEEGKIIRTGIVGAGQQGRSMVSQMVLMKGIMPAILADIDVQKAVNSFKNAGIHDEDIVIAHTLEDANHFMEKGKYVACQEADFISHANLVECAIDATGVPDVGAMVAVEALTHQKHVVMLNVETDVVISPYLCKLAKDNGVLYTGSAGDEPGAVMELFDFADSLGFDIKAMGKGKNNPVDREATPDTVREEALSKKLSPRMLCSFVDGTKTMVEMTAMSNATGFVPDIIGGHGVKSDLKGLNEKFKLKSEGGILNRHGIVEYVDGIAPGVFVTVASQSEEVAFQLNYLKVGEGPLWTLYRPFHLCCIETPLSVARLVIDNETTIVPKGGLVSECITVAKKDLKPGDTIDGIGGFAAYGSIAPKDVVDKEGYVPFGILNNHTKVVKSIKKGDFITWDMIEIDENSYVYKIRKLQDSIL